VFQSGWAPNNTWGGARGAGCCRSDILRLPGGDQAAAAVVRSGHLVPLRGERPGRGTPGCQGA
jgi:hypothetical protein